MQSALSNEAQTSGLVTAENLRTMTISKEELFARQKQNILDSLMETMVQVASKSGLSSYTANLTPQFDVALLTDIVTTLTGLGYTVKTEERTDEKLGKFIALIISW